MPFSQEVSPGVGIRRSSQFGGKLSDLLRVDATTQVPQWANLEYFVRVNDGNPYLNYIGVYLNAAATFELLHGADEASFAISGGDSMSLWVRWEDALQQTESVSLTLGVRTKGTGDLRLDGVVLFADTIVFHPFNGIVIAFGGDTQSPEDTDADGRMSDPVPDAKRPGNREDLFEIAQQLYDEGFDVYAYNENVLDGGAMASTLPYQEVVDAVTRRKVKDVAVFGYSHGGGATQIFADRLAADGYTVAATAYVDAIDHEGVNAENERPSSGAHLNIYQQNILASLGLTGGPGHNLIMPRDKEIDLTNTGTDHYLIDDRSDVRNEVKSWIKGHIKR